MNWIFQALVNWMFGGIALTLLTAGLLRLLSHSNATTRYLIWEFTLLSVIALPFFMADPPPTESVLPNFSMF